MEKFKTIDEVTIDNKNGIGAVAYNTDVDYFGLQVLMQPSVFLKLAAPLPYVNKNYSDKMKDYISNGGAIASPYLNLDVPSAWLKGDYSEPSKVIGHEGRNRLHSLIALEGDKPIEVHLFPLSLRARHISAEWVDSWNKILYNEMGILTLGPFFTVLNSPIKESVNTKIFNRGFETVTNFNEYTLIAKNGYLPYIPNKKAMKSEQFRIEARLGKILVGWVNFKQVKNHLEAIDVVVISGYRKQGIATAMYNFATRLGNTIEPSPLQTALGKKFWQLEETVIDKSGFFKKKKTDTFVNRIQNFADELPTAFAQQNEQEKNVNAKIHYVNKTYPEELLGAKKMFQIHILKTGVLGPSIMELLNWSLDPRGFDDAGLDANLHKIGIAFVDQNIDLIIDICKKQIDALEKIAQEADKMVWYAPWRNYTLYGSTKLQITRNLVKFQKYKDRLTNQ